MPQLSPDSKDIKGSLDDILKQLHFFKNCRGRQEAQASGTKKKKPHTPTGPKD